MLAWLLSFAFLLVVSILLSDWLLSILLPILLSSRATLRVVYVDTLGQALSIYAQTAPLRPNYLKPTQTPLNKSSVKPPAQKILLAT